MDPPRRLLPLNVPLIVGAGPSGLAVAACLKSKGVDSILLERSDGIASLWKHRTYDRLHLHLPKNLSQLPLMPFPSNFPSYPSKHQFFSYLESYAKHFRVNAEFNRTVKSADYDDASGLWKVMSSRSGEGEIEHLSRWLVVATGENADVWIPAIEGMEKFKGQKCHTSDYRNGAPFKGKRVLVVGCGNSGMEVCLDLCDHGAYPTLVVRNSVHVLPREVMGRSTFGLSTWLLRWLPLRAVDRLLVAASRFVLGDVRKFGIRRPPLGPLKLKFVAGKTPVLDIGTLARIKSGEVKVRPAIERVIDHGAEFVDGSKGDFDAIIFATGYRSNVPLWLKENGLFSKEDGLPKRPFPNGWKGDNGLYAVGFTKRGILGASLDAMKIADDIEMQWKRALK